GGADAAFAMDDHLAALALGGFGDALGQASVGNVGGAGDGAGGVLGAAADIKHRDAAGSQVVGLGGGDLADGFEAAGAGESIHCRDGGPLLDAVEADADAAADRGGDLAGGADEGDRLSFFDVRTDDAVEAGVERGPEGSGE